jgi:Predicted phosphosugar isomerases
MRILGIQEDELKRIDGYHTALEMERQLELWEEGIEIIKRNTDKIRAFLNKIEEVEGLKIYLVGAGSSAKAAAITENYLRRITKKEVISIASTTLIENEDNYILDNSPVLLVSLGGSGNTIKGLEAVEIFKKKGIELYQLLIICNGKGEIISKYGEDKNSLYIPIPPRTKDKSIAATGEFTLLIEYLLLIFDINNYDYYEEMFKNIIEDAGRFLKEDIYKSHAVSNKIYDTVAALGTGALNPLASEMCLKISELSTGLQRTEFHSMLEFRHGPKLAMNSKCLISFFFSNDSQSIKYELDVLKECYSNKINSTIVAISMDYDEEIDKNCDYYFYFNKNNFKYSDDSHIVFQYSLYLQSFAILNAIRRGSKTDLICESGIVNKVAQGVVIYKR